MVTQSLTCQLFLFASKQLQLSIHTKCSPTTVRMHTSWSLGTQPQALPSGTPCGLHPQTTDAAARCTSAVCACQPDDCQGEASLCAIVAQWPRRSKPCGLQMPFRCSQWSPHDFRRPRRNRRSHIDASHSRQPLIKGERSVRYEVNTVILEHCLQLCKSSANKVEGKGTRDVTS